MIKQEFDGLYSRFKLADLLANKSTNQKALKNLCLHQKH